MKKTYIEPKSVCVALKSEKLLGNLSGDGLNMKINSTDASGAAEGRRGGDWEDE